MHKYSLASTGMLMIGFYYFSESGNFMKKQRHIFIEGKGTGRELKRPQPFSNMGCIQYELSQILLYELRFY